MFQESRDPYDQARLKMRDRSQYLTCRYSERMEANPIVAQLACAAMSHETAQPAADDDLK